MKKSKIRFDQQKLLQFLMLHGEKFAFGAFVAFFLMLLWWSIGVAIYERRPTELAEAAGNAETAIRDARFELDPTAESLKLPEPPLLAQAEKGNKPVEVTWYRTTIEWDPPLLQTAVKRGEPTYLAVRELRAAPKFGGVLSNVMQPDPNDPLAPQQQVTVTQGRLWVSLTGLVPVNAQLIEYRNVFQNAQLKDAVRDVPVYVDFKVQRAPATSAAPPSEDEYKDIDVLAALMETATWSGAVTDMVGTEYQLIPLTQPLPPLVSGQLHGNEATHPKIPLAATQQTVTVAQPEPEVQPTTSSPRTALEFLQQRGSGQSFGATAAAAAATALQQQNIEYKLFRFLDFTAEPGRRYVYRVKLVLQNPNLGLSPRFLAKAELAVGDTREAPWSDPSPPLAVPRDSAVLAGTIKPQNEPNEPSVTLFVTKFDRNTAHNASKEFPSLSRGTLVNFGQVPTTIKQAEAEQDVTVDFLTDMLLVDMSGGKPLPGGTAKAPATLLFVGSGGEVMLRTQLQDAASYAARKAGDVLVAEEGAEAGVPANPETPSGLFDLGGPQ